MDFIITVAAKDLKIITVEAIKRRLLYLEYRLDHWTCLPRSHYMPIHVVEKETQT